MEQLILISISLDEFKTILSECVITFLNESNSRPVPRQQNVTPKYFCSTLGYMKLPTFYQLVGKGLIPGAFKIGRKWFIDLEEFESESKKSK